MNSFNPVSLFGELSDTSLIQAYAILVTKKEETEYHHRLANLAKQNSWTSIEGVSRKQLNRPLKNRLLTEFSETHTGWSAFTRVHPDAPDALHKENLVFVVGPHDFGKPSPYRPVATYIPTPDKHGLVLPVSLPDRIHYFPHPEADILLPLTKKNLQKASRGGNENNIEKIKGAVGKRLRQAQQEGMRDIYNGSIKQRNEFDLLNLHTRSMEEALADIDERFRERRRPVKPVTPEDIAASIARQEENQRRKAARQEQRRLQEAARMAAMKPPIAADPSTFEKIRQTGKQIQDSVFSFLTFGLLAFAGRMGAEETAFRVRWDKAEADRKSAKSHRATPIELNKQTWRLRVLSELWKDPSETPRSIKVKELARLVHQAKQAATERTLKKLLPPQIEGIPLQPEESPAFAQTELREQPAYTPEIVAIPEIPAFSPPPQTPLPPVPLSDDLLKIRAARRHRKSLQQAHVRKMQDPVHLPSPSPWWMKRGTVTEARPQ